MKEEHLFPPELAEKSRVAAARDAFNGALCNALRTILRNDPACELHVVVKDGMRCADDERTGVLKLGQNGELVMNVAGRTVNVEKSPTTYVLTSDSLERYTQAVRTLVLGNL